MCYTRMKLVWQFIDCGVCLRLGFRRLSSSNEGLLLSFPTFFPFSIEILSLLGFLIYSTLFYSTVQYLWRLPGISFKFSFIFQPDSSLPRLLFFCYDFGWMWPWTCVQRLARRWRSIPHLSRFRPRKFSYACNTCNSSH